jgi:hypothetical protein
MSQVGCGCGTLKFQPMESADKIVYNYDTFHWILLFYRSHRLMNSAFFLGVEYVVDRLKVSFLQCTSMRAGDSETKSSIIVELV